MNMYNTIRLDEEHEPAENGNMMENMLSVAKFDKKFIEQRKVFLWGVVDDKSAKDITARLMYLDAVDQQHPNTSVWQ
jgi:ATP-dependent Clp protease protease subunit